MVTKAADQVDDCVAMLDKIETRLRSLDRERQALQNEIDQIQQAGWVEAKPFYRDGKYLYLIYPMRDGERKREYIGGDPEKILDALDRIERKGRYDQLSQKLAHVDQQLYGIRQNLVRALSGGW